MDMLCTLIGSTKALHLLILSLKEELDWKVCLLPCYANIIVVLNFMICSLIEWPENVHVLGGVSLKMPLQSVIIALTELCDLEMPQKQFMTMYWIELKSTAFYG